MLDFVRMTRTRASATGRPLASRTVPVSSSPCRSTDYDTAPLLARTPGLERTGSASRCSRRPLP